MNNLSKYAIRHCVDCGREIEVDVRNPNPQIRCCGCQLAYRRARDSELHRRRREMKMKWGKK